ncbi:hypothetical protein GE21DRAFT_1264 [Neurospora crassa]|uniref:Uncharacterized protein n=1 Tax=Neurospora crassa (strain ATCC 24698 / 74-OR23-1A / CBS 708.71 / DSM 1257 / FGSC 987) TaxID=367110 RepID=Q7SGV9_NEUCR|nr:hypothetical protein NCU03210 [Neurospora crassa OR74A]EAA36074.1 hypothetical protein NCU03210 [Neurospora crassa OR74A]KHE82953.1 hypothetical protein GE21DRAFT_1264 [Neurospora crassa]|eukprot:XP_965310.1 hypothetical protein NCU03210 [Neurospora crassa OR74A]
MQYSTRNLAACLLAICIHDTLAKQQAIPVQSSSVNSETTVPIATSALSASVAPGTTIPAEVVASTQGSIQSLTSIGTPAASEAAAGELRPLSGLASSAVDGAATLASTTSELIPLVPQISTAAEISEVSPVQSTEVTSAAISTAELSSLEASSTAVAEDPASTSSVALETTTEDSALPSSVALETTTTEASVTETAGSETAGADATSTTASNGFLTSVVTESSASASSATVETSRAAITSRPPGFFPITNSTTPGASVAGGGQPHGTGAAHQSLVTGISKSPSGSGGVHFGNSTQTSGVSTAAPASRGGSGSLTTLTTVSDGMTQTLVTAITSQTSGVAQNASTTATTRSNSGAGRPMDLMGGAALIAGAWGVLGMLLL